MGLFGKKKQRRDKMQEMQSRVFFARTIGTSY